MKWDVGFKTLKFKMYNPVLYIICSYRCDCTPRNDHQHRRCKCLLGVWHVILKGFLESSTWQSNQSLELVSATVLFKWILKMDCFSWRMFWTLELETRDSIIKIQWMGPIGDFTGYNRSTRMDQLDLKPTSYNPTRLITCCFGKIDRNNNKRNLCLNDGFWIGGKNTTRRRNFKRPHTNIFKHLEYSRRYFKCCIAN